jgi:hypothetical protein
VVAICICDYLRLFATIYEQFLIYIMSRVKSRPLECSYFPIIIIGSGCDLYLRLFATICDYLRTIPYIYYVSCEKQASWMLLFPYNYYREWLRSVFTTIYDYLRLYATIAYDYMRLFTNICDYCLRLYANIYEYMRKYKRVVAIIKIIKTKKNLIFANNSHFSRYICEYIRIFANKCERLRILLWNSFRC